MADRFVVKSNVDLVSGGWPASDLDDAHFSVFDSLKNEVVGTDGGEPEDQLLVRDWRWVTEALNAVDRERLAARHAIDGRDEWMCGYAAAIAAVQRLYRESTIAKQVMICDGVTPEKLKEAGVEEFDMEQIERVWKHG